MRPSDAYMRQGLIIIGSDNGLSQSQRQAIIWTNAGILLIRPSGTNFSEILIEIDVFPFKKMHLKMSSAKCRPFRLGLDVFNTFRYPDERNVLNLPQLFFNQSKRLVFFGSFGDEGYIRKKCCLSCIRVHCFCNHYNLSMVSKRDSIKLHNTILYQKAGF